MNNKELLEVIEQAIRTNATILYLSNNKLTKLPKEIGNLKSLQKLDLSNNALTELPKEIGNLTSLQWLDLSNNALTELPKEIGNLKSLQRLYFFSNNKEEREFWLGVLPLDLEELREVVRTKCRNVIIPIAQKYKEELLKIESNPANVLIRFYLK